MNCDPPIAKTLFTPAPQSAKIEKKSTKTFGKMLKKRCTIFHVSILNMLHVFIYFPGLFFHTKVSLTVNVTAKR